MAREPIVYIDRNKQLYKGRDAQVAALAPFPKRHNGNHWQLNRRPFVHGFYPGGAGCMTGKDYAPLCKIKEAAFEAGVPIEEIEQLTMADLIITPDLISATVGGRTITTVVTRAPARRGPIDAVSYTPGELTGSTQTQIVQLNVTPTFPMIATSGSVPAPIIIERVNLSLSGNSGFEGHLTLSIPAVGWSYTNYFGAAGRIPIQPANFSVNEWLTSGSAYLYMRIEDPAGSGGAETVAWASFTWRELKRAT